MKKKLIVLATLMAIVPSAFAASGPQDIIPVPVKYEIFMEEYFPKVDGSDVRVHLGDKRFLKEINSLNIPEFARNEAYKLAVGKKGIDIFAVSEAGVYRAKTSLGMMMDKDSILTRCVILDYPRFRHRGLMLDISRNFRDKDFILKQLDAMAAVKMSTLHLHLTDDAGWRIQIDAYSEYCLPSSLHSSKFLPTLQAALRVNSGYASIWILHPASSVNFYRAENLCYQFEQG